MIITIQQAYFIIIVIGIVANILYRILRKQKRQGNKNLYIIIPYIFFKLLLMLYFIVGTSCVLFMLIAV